MDIKTPHASYAKAPQLVDDYDAAERAVKKAKQDLRHAESELEKCQRRLADALIPAGAREGQSYRVWVPQGLLELIAHLGLHSRCSVAWITRDESREPKVQALQP